MEQKIVIKISTCCDKRRAKAMQMAFTTDGVHSVAFEGEEKEKLVVIGERVDAASMTEALRRKIRYAELVSVEEVKKKPKNADDHHKKPIEESSTLPIPHCHGGPPQCELVNIVYDPNPNSTCIIM